MGGDLRGSNSDGGKYAPPGDDPRTLERAVNQLMLDLYHLLERWRRYDDGLEDEIRAGERQLWEAQVRVRSLEDTVAHLHVHLTELEKPVVRHEQATGREGVP